MTVSLRKFLDNLPWITGTAGIREYYPEDMNGFVKSLVAGERSDSNVPVDFLTPLSNHAFKLTTVVRHFLNSIVYVR